MYKGSQVFTHPCVVEGAGPPQEAREIRKVVLREAELAEELSHPLVRHLLAEGKLPQDRIVRSDYVPIDDCEAQALLRGPCPGRARDMGPTSVPLPARAQVDPGA